jgi:hypothetical protein
VYSIGFEDEWTGAAEQATAWDPAANSPESGVCLITRGTSLRGEPLNAWLDAPPERAATYLQWFSQVSVDVQTSLRRWLPYLLLRDDDVLNHRDLRSSLVFYAATRPYYAKVRGTFTWDVICPDSMSSVFRSGSQNLPAVLESAQRYALAGGRPDVAQALAPSQMRNVLISVRRDPRALKTLLTIEGKLIEALLALAEKGYTLNRTLTAPKNLYRFCGAWAHGVQTRLRRVLGPVGLPGLVDLVLVEGTASLARCVGHQTEKCEWTEFRAASTLPAPAGRDLPLAA